MKIETKTQITAPGHQLSEMSTEVATGEIARVR